MSFLNNLLDALKKEVKEVENKVSEAVANAAKEEAEKPEQPIIPQGQGINGHTGIVIGGGSVPSSGGWEAEDSWYDVVPEEECQYNSGMNYLDYFTKIFREDFPEYEIGLETLAAGRRYAYTFMKDGAPRLVVELMTEKSEANKFRRDTQRRGIPYVRFYFDHSGWWNTRRYVNERVSGALK